MESLKCANCETKLVSQSTYCHHCGQRSDNEKSLTAFITHFLNDYFTFDSKILKSIGPLVAKPGYLTKEYLAGRRVSYIPPLRLFIFTSIIFFLMLKLFNHSAVDTSSSIIREDQIWDSFFSSWLPKLFFVLLPLFSLILSALFKKSKKGHLTHFLFSFHFHSTIFFVGIFYVLLSWLMAALGFIIVNQFLFAAVAIFLMIYLWLAMRRVYEESIGKTTYKYFILAVAYSILMGVSVVLLALFSI